jgi:adenylate cyclase
MNLFAELRRRNVIRMGGLYLVIAWLVVQVAETTLPIFDTPGWVLKTLVVMLSIGFIPALVFSWIYELTPEGLRRDDGLTPATARVAATGTRMDRLMLVGMLAVVAVVAADRYWPREATALQADAGAETVAGIGSRTAATAPDVAPGPAAVPAESIAVLPFADLSPAGDQAYFADGISEEILNVLVSVKGLTVASRTSSFQFRAQESLGIPAIADALRVRHVLEGSVRKAGERIRVTAQLIDASSDAHLWSETFDRTLTTENLFDIQDEIAQAIVAAIDSNLGVQVGAVDSVPQRTDNLDAYALYLQARPSYYRRENFAEMAELLGRAVELDPGFVDALAMRASVFTLSADYGEPLGGTSQQARSTAHALGMQALAMDPGHGLALGVITQMRRLERGSTHDAQSFAEGLEAYTTALARDPNNLDLLNWRGRQLAWAGRLDEGEHDFRRCSEIEPLYAPCRGNLAALLMAQGRSLEAKAEFTTAAAMGALPSTVLGVLVTRALDWREAFYFLGNELPTLRGFHAFDDLYEALAQPDGDHALLLSRLAALDAPGSPVVDLSLLRIALGDHEHRVSIYLTWLPAFAAYRKSPAFKATVIDGGLLAYWRAEGFPPMCRPRGIEDFECD